MICKANQLTGFYMRATLTFNGLKNNFVKVVLVSAKSRVSPLRKVTIPRLELFGNLLLSRLISNVINNLTSVYTIDKILAWTDSSIALHEYRISTKSISRSYKPECN